MIRARRLWIAPILAAALGGIVAGCGEDDKDPVGPGPTVCGDSPGTICSWAGTGQPGFNGDGKALLDSRLYWPIDLEFMPSGRVVVLDWNNHRVREVTAAGSFETIIGTDMLGDGPEPEIGSDLEFPGVLGTTVNLNHPTDILELPDGRVILTAWHNHKLRVWDPDTKNVVVVCGRNAAFAGDGAHVADVRLSQPQQTVLAPDGALLVLDQRNQRVRRIDLVNDTVSSVVGNGMAGFSGDGGPPTEASINLPMGSNPSPGGSIAMDAQGRLFISDCLNNRIRRVDFAANVIETIAGDGVIGFDGDGGSALEASFNNPRDIEIGPDGALYVADELNNRIRRIDLTSGIITTVAGNGTADFSGDGGLATAAGLFRPSGIAFDSAGDLYIADSYNHRIRVVRR